MFNKKVIYLSALFLCLQDTISMDMDVDVGVSSPGKRRRLLDESDEDLGMVLTAQSAETLTDTILREQQWSSAEELANFYYARQGSHPKNLLKGMIWHCIVNHYDIGLIHPSEDIPVEVRTLVSSLSDFKSSSEVYAVEVRTFVSSLSDFKDSSEVCDVVRLLQKIQVTLGTKELIIALNPLMTPRFQQFLELFLNNYDNLVEGDRLAQQLSQDPERVARGFQDFGAE